MPSGARMRVPGPRWYSDDTVAEGLKGESPGVDFPVPYSLGDWVDRKRMARKALAEERGGLRPRGGFSQPDRGATQDTRHSTNRSCW